MADRVLALVHYYAREGYFRHVQTVCNEVLKKRAGDPVLTFWRAYGLLQEGATAEVCIIMHEPLHIAAAYKLAILLTG